MAESVIARYEARDGGWLVSAGAQPARAPEAVAFARTLEKARAAIVSELAKARGTYAGRIAAEDRVALSAPADAALSEARSARDAALKAAAQSNAATVTAAKALAAEGLALRDIGYLLGVSHARVHQVLAGSSNGTATTTQPRSPKSTSTTGRKKR